MDYSAWTADQLQARFTASGGELARLENERQALLVEMEQRKRVSSVKARIVDLTPLEKVALREVLDVQIAEQADAIVVVK